METSSRHDTMYVNFEVVKRQSLATAVCVFDTDERNRKLTTATCNARRNWDRERQLRLLNVSDDLRLLTDDGVLELPRRSTLLVTQREFLSQGHLQARETQQTSKETSSGISLPWQLCTVIFFCFVFQRALPTGRIRCSKTSSGESGSSASV